MEQSSTYGTSACDGCAHHSFVLRAVRDTGAKLCDDCTHKSERIDQQLARTRSEDPVACDGCGARAPFDARIAVVVRACGGPIFCDRCKSFAAERQAS